VYNAVVRLNHYFLRLKKIIFLNTKFSILFIQRLVENLSKFADYWLLLGTSVFTSLNVFFVCFSFVSIAIYWHQFSCCCCVLSVLQSFKGTKKYSNCRKNFVSVNSQKHSSIKYNVYCSQLSKSIHKCVIRYFCKLFCPMLLPHSFKWNLQNHCFVWEYIHVNVFQSCSLTIHTYD